MQAATFRSTGRSSSRFARRSSPAIRDDEPLPSVRSLAEELLINPNTVLRAYGELAREGIIESRPGRGMFISKRRQIYSKAERTKRIDRSVTSLVTEAFTLGFTAKEIVDQVSQKANELDPNLKGRS
jgi:GntR family transcriptional regulator